MIFIDEVLESIWNLKPRSLVMLTMSIQWKVLTKLPQNMNVVNGYKHYDDILFTFKIGSINFQLPNETEWLSINFKCLKMSVERGEFENNIKISETKENCIEFKTFNFIEISDFYHNFNTENQDKIENLMNLIDKWQIYIDLSCLHQIELSVNCMRTMHYRHDNNGANLINVLSKSK